MKRRLLNFVTVLSVALCIAIVGLSVRGGFARDAIVSHLFVREFPNPNPRAFPASWYKAWRVSVHNFRDCVSLAWGPTSGSGSAPLLRRDREGPYAAMAGWAFPGATAKRYEDGMTVIQLSHWLLLVVASILPGLAASRIVRARLRRAAETTGHCPTCGYDLRATPGRCPECGTVAAVNTSG